VGLFALHAEDLGLRPLDDFALLLDGGRVDAVFGVAESDAGFDDLFAQDGELGVYRVEHLPL
jgi:hypothetical protein